MISQLKIITDLIKSKSLEIGFSKIGITSPDLMNKDGEKLQHWISSGYYGGMEWMAKNPLQRINPDSLLPGVKSVIALGLNYYNDVRYSNEKDNGKISRYALGNDYHKVIKKMLKELCKFIEEKSGERRYKLFVDSGKILEKAFGAKAGIGWIGKNTLLLNKELGSWFFIGIVLIDIPLIYDLQQDELCGECNKCVESCPANALIEPYLLDSKKCISYLTQYESVESYNNENWVYGCDICQEVCPWNKNSKPADLEEMRQIIDHNININNDISKNEFELKYGKTPVNHINYKQFNQNLENILKNNYKEKE